MHAPGLPRTWYSGSALARMPRTASRRLHATLAAAPVLLAHTFLTPYADNIRCWRYIKHYLFVSGMGVGLADSEPAIFGTASDGATDAVLDLEPVDGIGISMLAAVTSGIMHQNCVTP